MDALLRGAVDGAGISISEDISTEFLSYTVLNPAPVHTGTSPPPTPPVATRVR